MTLAHFSFPTSIRFGAGAHRLIRDALRAADAARVLVVTDRILARLPLFARVREAIGDEVEVTVFCDVAGNPTRSQAMAGAALARALRPDAVIGVGGGAAIDVAKVVAMLAVNGGDVLEYAHDAARPRVLASAPPALYAVPTTAGTGSEVGRSSVISDDDTGVKRIVFSPRLLPSEVFADPELTLGLPPAITAATGMDALTHNVEAYLSPVYHPLCDGIALEGLRLVARALATAVETPSALDARRDMMMASMMGAIAFQKELGAVHACAHALSTVAGLHHGLANALMIDAVMRFNAPAADARLGELARITGGTAPEDFVDWLVTLKQRIGIPARLSDAGISASMLDALVDVAYADGCHRTNPRPCTHEDLRRLFEEAM